MKFSKSSATLNILTFAMLVTDFKCLTDSSTTTSTTTMPTFRSSRNETEPDRSRSRVRCTSPLGSSDGSIVLESEDGEISGLTTLQVCLIYLK